VLSVRSAEEGRLANALHCGPSIWAALNRVSSERRLVGSVHCRQCALCSLCAAFTERPAACSVQCAVCSQQCAAHCAPPPSQKGGRTACGALAQCELCARAESAGLERVGVCVRAARAPLQVSNQVHLCRGRPQMGPLTLTHSPHSDASPRDTCPLLSPPFAHCPNSRPSQKRANFWPTRPIKVPFCIPMSCTWAGSGRRPQGASGPTTVLRRLGLREGCA